jgi:hypothetical protein
MRRVTPWIISLPSLIVILVACLVMLSTWVVRSFLTNGINVGLEGIATVIRSGEATLGRFDHIVSETLPTAMSSVETILAADRDQSPSMTEIQQKAVLKLRIELLPELEQLKSTGETISQIILSANETLLFINTLPLIQLPPLPAKRWQSLNNSLSSLRDNAQGLVDLLMQPKTSEFLVNDSEIRQNMQMLENISQELKDRLVKIKAELSTILNKIEVVGAKITGWITWLLIGIFLVMFWVAGGQIYLLWHFLKTRSSRAG